MPNDAIETYETLLASGVSAEYLGTLTIEEYYELINEQHGN